MYSRATIDVGRHGFYCFNKFHTFLFEPKSNVRSDEVADKNLVNYVRLLPSKSFCYLKQTINKLV